MIYMIRRNAVDTDTAVVSSTLNYPPVTGYLLQDTAGYQQKNRPHSLTMNHNACCDRCLLVCTFNVFAPHVRSYTPFHSVTVYHTPTWESKRLLQ